MSVRVSGSLPFAAFEATSKPLANMESPAHIFRVVPWKVFALQPAAVVNKKTISSLEGAITEPNSTQTVPKQPELDRPVSSGRISGKSVHYLWRRSGLTGVSI